MAYIRRVKTKSGAIAVQIVHKRYGQVEHLEHLGSAHDKREELELLTLAHQKLNANQIPLFIDPSSALKLKLRSSVSRLLYQVIMDQYQRLGFGVLSDQTFASLCVARIVEPVSKLDSLRVLSDLGVNDIYKNQLYECLRRVIKNGYRETIANLCFSFAKNQNIGLVLYDVTTLYFEVQKEDDFRKSGLGKERRLEPQIVIGLLVDQNGFPLGIHSFTGNTAETKTILPVIQEFCSKHEIKNLTIVADAAMLSANNLSEITQAGFTYIVGSRMHKIPYEIEEFQKQQTMSDNQIIVSQKLDHKIIYQYKEKRAKLDIRNIEKQISKAEKIIKGKVKISRAKFLSVSTKTKQLNQKLVIKAYALAGIKGYVTNLTVPSQRVIDWYHQLFHVEASFRMAKSDFRARPIFHRKRDSIEAHLTLVFTCLAIGKCLEQKTQMSIKSLVKTLRPVRSGMVIINGQEYEASEELTPVIHNLLQKLDLRY